MYNKPECKFIYFSSLRDCYLFSGIFMNYDLWMNEFDPEYFSGISLLTGSIIGILLFLGILYIAIGSIYLKLLFVDKILRMVFPTLLVDDLPEFLLTLLITAMFPPYLIMALASNGNGGPGLIYGGLVAWLGWIIALSFIYPSAMLYVLVMIIFIIFLNFFIILFQKLISFLGAKINSKALHSFIDRLK